MQGGFEGQPGRSKQAEHPAGARGGETQDDTGDRQASRRSAEAQDALQKQAEKRAEDEGRGHAAGSRNRLCYDHSREAHRACPPNGSLPCVR